jgi:Flp pilus assembly protein TadG
MSWRFWPHFWADQSGFRRDESGAGTVFSLGLLFLAALFGGLAVDVGNAWRYNELLKTTADVAAHAGAVVLSQGGTSQEARDAALAALDFNMPEARFGRILASPTEDVRPVHYDVGTNRLTGDATDDGGVNAIAVTVQRSAASGNPIPTMLLRLAGSDAFDVKDESVVALVATQACGSADGLYAQGLLLPGPGSHIGPGYCLHAQDRVVPGEGSLFESGSGLSMPDLSRCGSNCTDAVSQGAEAAEFEANLIRPDLAGMIRRLRAQMTARPGSEGHAPSDLSPTAAQFFASRPLPEDLSALDEVGVPIDRLKTGRVVQLSPTAFLRARSLPQGLVYLVLCAPPPGKALPGSTVPVPIVPGGEAESGEDRVLTLSARVGGVVAAEADAGTDTGADPANAVQGRVFRNLVLISDCQIHLDASARVEGSVILDLRSGSDGGGYDIIAEPGAQIGDPDHSCDPARRSRILALGSILLPAGVIGTNVGVVAGRDIRIPPPIGAGPMIYGVTGLGMHAGGGISLDVAHDFTACGAKGTEAGVTVNDPFSPDLRVLRQVDPAG